MNIISTIPQERKIIPDFQVSRPDGQTWVNLTGYANEFEVQLGSIEEIGTGNTGGDSIVRQLSCNVYNDMINIPIWDSSITREETEIVGDSSDIIGDEKDGAEKLINILFDTDNSLKGDMLNPRDRQSDWNQFDADEDGTAEYNPMLWPTRECELRVAIFEDGINGLYNQEVGTTQKIQESLGTGDGTSQIFQCDRYPIYTKHVEFYVDGTKSENYSINYNTGEITTSESGVLTINYIYYKPLFAGYLGDNIDTNEEGVNKIICRDYSMRLMKEAITEEKTFSYDNGVNAEVAIQDILDYYFGVGEINLYCPVSPEFMVEEVKCKDESVFDATQKIVSEFGWFLGYLYNSNNNKWEYTLLEPPRDKDKSTADYTITAQHDIFKSDIKITSKDIRNKIIVPYTDSDGNKQSITVSDPDSQDEFWEKPMRINMNNSRYINTAQEATDFGNAALHDLKDLSAESKITMPIFPEADLYTGINFDNPLLSSTVDFYGVQSLRHTIIISENNWGSDFTTEIIGAGKVIGSHKKWLAMETRPGAAKPIDEREIPGESINAPTDISIIDSGTEQVEDVSMAYAVLSWNAPSGYKPSYYVIQMQQSGQDWSNYQEFYSRTTIQKITFVQGIDYEIRIAGFSKVNRMGELSSTFQIFKINNDNAPIKPIFDDVNCYFDDVIYLKWLDNNNKLPIIYEIREDTNFGDGNHLYQGKNTNLIIDNLNELNNPGLATQTFYIKALSYNDVYSSSYDSVSVVNTAPNNPTGLTVNSTISQLQMTIDDPEINDLDYVEYEIHESSDYSDSSPSSYKRKEFDILVPVKVDGTNYVRVRFVDILGQTSDWVTANTNANLITDTDMQGEIFQIQASSSPSKSDLSSLWDKDTTTGLTYSSVPTITFKFPQEWLFDLVRFYVDSSGISYTVEAKDRSGTWNTVIATKNTVSGWNVVEFDNDQLVVTRELRINFQSALSIYELKFWKKVLADEIISQTLYLTSNMTIQNENSSVTFNANGGNIAGWVIEPDMLQSSTSGERIQLDETNNRVTVIGDVDGNGDYEEAVVVGYIGGLPKNDGTGSWEAGTYGIWAATNGKLKIDADVVTEQFEIGQKISVNKIEPKNDTDNIEIGLSGQTSQIKGNLDTLSNGFIAGNLKVGVSESNSGNTNGTVRNIHVSSSEPTTAVAGDIWIQT